MSFIINNYCWPPSDGVAIANAQQVAANQSVLFNGTLAKTSASDGTIHFPGISRTLQFSMPASISSSGNATFFIKGKRDGLTVNETLNIVTQAITTVTVETSNFFDSVDNIICTTGTVTGFPVTIGTGTKGMTRPFLPNSFITSSQVATSIDTTLISGNVNYNVIGSIQNWYNTTIDSTQTIPITAPSIIFLNNSLQNSISGQYKIKTPVPASDTSFITAVDLPLTMVAVLISETSPSNLNITISTPKLT